MIGVQQWTGREASALRAALRMSTRTFAEHLGVALRTVAKWEKLGPHTRPRPDTQAILDTALARADTAARVRFETLLSDLADRFAYADPVCAADYETWAEDIDRVLVCLGRQDFSFASILLNRWLDRDDPRALDDRGRYLYGRSLVLLGDLRRDQGVTLGPLSAQHSYKAAHGLFSELAIPRRVAQTELSLAVIDEMSGNLEISARHYERLATDDRLSARDRARARLWIGTALSKYGENEYAVKAMMEATRGFEDLAEPDDWSVAHQKVALAYRGSGDLTRALHNIDIARSTGIVETPMQRVRLDTAHGHILLSDPATRDDGRSVLDGAAQVARQYGLSHQLRSIEGIRRSFGDPSAALST
ncbi:helix-turn-helix domain-containing protein [Actinoallomurus sp. CA-142502]|uniref:helix-turn-helix domain-containing protein n=1 Tax=Actinoallomurus sp. CA-142502 TaxID=3239885 RepID=UPI003D8DBDEE